MMPVLESRSLLTTPVLGSPACEWLQWWAGFGPCSQHLSLVLQEVSASVVSWIWILLTMPVLGSPGSEWLQDLDPTHDLCPWLSR